MKEMSILGLALTIVCLILLLILVVNSTVKLNESNLAEPYQAVCVQGYEFLMSNRTYDLTQIQTGNNVLHCSNTTDY